MATKQCKDFQLVLQVKAHKLVGRKPIRRTSKSFSGCYSCKRKKIKCDETKSKCKNCVRCGLECVWPPAKKTAVAGVNKPKVNRAKSEIKSVEGTRLKSPETMAWLAYSFGRVDQKSPKSRYFETILDTKAQNAIETENLELIPAALDTGATGKERTLSWTRESELSSNESVSPRSIGPLVARDVAAEPTGVAVDATDMAAVGWSGINLFGDLSNGKNWGFEKEDINASNSLLGLRGSPYQFRSPVPQVLEIADNGFEVSETAITIPPTFGVEYVIDSFFFAHFAGRFLPTIAQPHFHHSRPWKNLVLSAAANSEMLREIFVACGASLVAFDNVLYRAVAQQKYKIALLHFLGKIKHGLEGGEDWFFIAVQVLQTLCLRDPFGGANATRCAAHFSAAYKIILKLLDKPHVNGDGPQYSPLEKVLIENFIFNYSITIFYCDHDKLTRMVPNPFDFFSMANTKLAQMSTEDGSPQSSRMSMLAFQIAAKCSWLCRLKLPLDEADQKLHFEILLFAEAILFSLESVDFSPQEVLVRNTVSVAKVVLRSSIILLTKMLDMEGVRAHLLQHLVVKIVLEIDQPYNRDIIFPIWSVMIGASTALDIEHKEFFKRSLEKLVNLSKSKIAMQVLNHLEGLWEIYNADEPFELLFDTKVLDQVCN